MFTFLSRFRRQTAVLTALALVASVLVAVPASAADDPEPSYPATFDACIGVGTSSFTDVPPAHANAGDIDCIAYYGITKGTSASTYSPLMSVTREHMALFLTRLAGLVNIPMVSDPADAGFTDTGDLSDESQTAINQLADLGITRGTSDTTYSPSDTVQRGHMALFISRLMDKMTPVGGKDSVWGHTPSDVKDDVDETDAIGSPFTDLDRVTKETYDAITNLWELGVASGINETSYGPSQSITRAAMAGFMAGVMDHSNLRPAGVTVQADTTSAFGDITGDDAATVVISVRSMEGFAPMVDQAVDHFSSAQDNGGLVKGKCDSSADSDVDDDCEWNETDDLTGADGNLTLEGVSVTEAEGTRIVYAWIGDEDGAMFNANEVDYASASITAMKDEEALKATSTINEEADTTGGHRVDLDKVDSVTITVQLVDTANSTSDGPADDAKAVARSGQKVTVQVTQTADVNSDGDISAIIAGFSSTNVATLTTDADGQVTYTVEGPDDDDDKNDVQLGDDTDPTTAGVQPATAAAGLEDRIDAIVFTYASDNDGSPNVSSVTFTIRWSEANPVTTKAEATANPFVIREADGDAKVLAAVTFFDQYGNGYRQASGQKVGIEFGEEQDSDGNAIDPVANVNGNGMGRRGTTLKNQAAGTPIPVTYTEDPDEDDPDTADANENVDLPADVEDDLDTPGSIQVVVIAEDDSTGEKRVHTLYADDNMFTVEGPDTGTNAELLYSYDSDDKFTQAGQLISLEKFEELLANPDSGANAAVVDVVVYRPNGESIFQVDTASS